MTSHGGTLKASQTFDTVDGKLRLRVGDVHFCPRCKCPSTILDGDWNYTIDGKAQAWVGSNLSCGARIIQGGVTRSFRTSEGTAGKSPLQEATTQFANVSTKAYDQHFLVVDRQTGEALSGFVYGLNNNGQLHEDKLYANGATAKAFSNHPDEVQLVYLVQVKPILKKRKQK